MGLSGHQKCWVKGCNRDKKNSPKFAFHKFPTDPVQCLEWVRLSGDSNLLLVPHESLKINRAVCSKHFTADKYRVHGNILSGLIRNAMPSIMGTEPIPDSALPSSLYKPFVASKSVPSGRLENIPPNVKEISAPKITFRPPLGNITNLVVNPSTSVSRSVSVSSLSLPCATIQSIPVPASVSSSQRLPGDGLCLNDFPLPPVSIPLPSPCTPAVINVSTKRDISSVPSSCDRVPINKRRRLDFSDDSIRSPSLICLGSPAFTASTPLVDGSSDNTGSSLSNVNGSDSGISSSVLTPGNTSSHGNHKRSKSSKSTVRTTVLGAYGLSQQEVTPKKKKIIDDNKLLRAQIRSLKRSLEAVKGNRKALVKLANGTSVSNLSKRMKTKEAAALFEAQLANAGKSKKGFRYTLEQKTVALTLFKSSRKNYSLLCKMLNLPSATTLKCLMNKVKFEVGVNKHFFGHLKEVIKDFSPRDRACIVMWDEVQIAKSVNYNESKDCVEGYENHGDGEEQKEVANKGLVFMVQSLARKWKQPVAYYFSKDETPKDVLFKLIACVITNLQYIGFDVRCSVSDQGGNNRAAVGMLRSKFMPSTSDYDKPSPLCENCKKKKVVINNARKERKRKLEAGIDKASLGDAINFSKQSCSTCRSLAFRPSPVTYYCLNNGTKIYHIWDVPHLLKLLRNNFQNYNVHFGNGQVAKWSHIVKLKEQDGIEGTFYHLVLKLTDMHIRACHNSDKMKVSLAAQVLSCKVANSLRKIHDWSNGKAIPGCLATSEFIYFCDQLFDSFNGGSSKRSGKALRCNLSDNSPHLKFWEEAEAKIRKWWFVGSPRVFSSTVGWVENMSAVKGLWADLKEDLNFQYLNLRKLNQDPLENLFSVIKSNGQKVPTVAQFIGGLKTALVTNLRNSSIRGANCQSDGGTLLTDLTKFFTSVVNNSTPDRNNLQEVFVNEPDEEFTPEDERDILNLKSAPPLKSVPQPVDTADIKQEGRDLFDDLFEDSNPSQEEEPDEDGESDVEEVPIVPQTSTQPITGFVSQEDIPGICEEMRKKSTKKKKVAKKAQPDPAALGERAIAKENRGLWGNRRKLTAYVTGFIVKKTLTRVRKCVDCKKSLVTDNPTDDHDLVVAFERDDVKRRLTYAQTYVIDIVVRSVDIFLKLMHTHFHKPGLMATIFENIHSSVDLSHVGCLEHRPEVQRLILLYFCRVSIYHRCRILNRQFAQSWQNKNSLNNFRVNNASKSKGKQASTNDCSSRVAEETVDDPASTESHLLTPEVVNNLLHEDF